jgi:hypothetical protein
MYKARPTWRDTIVGPPCWNSTVSFQKTNIVTKKLLVFSRTRADTYVKVKVMWLDGNQENVGAVGYDIKAPWIVYMEEIYISTRILQGVYDRSFQSLPLQDDSSQPRRG